MQLFRNIGSIFFHPIQTLRRLMIGKPAPTAWSIFTGSLIALGLDQWMALPDKGVTATSSFLSFFVWELVFIFVSLFVITAVIHLIADMLGGAGRGLNVLFFFMISTIPFWLLIPFSIIDKMVFDLHIVYAAAKYLLVIWCFILMFISVKELYRFSVPKALLIFLLPALAVFAGIGFVYLIMPHFDSFMDPFIHLLNG